MGNTCLRHWILYTSTMLTLIRVTYTSYYPLTSCLHSSCITAVGTKSRYSATQPRNRGSIRGRRQWFPPSPKCLDQSWCPGSLLFITYWGLVSRRQSGRDVGLNKQTHLVTRLRMCGAMSSRPFCLHGSKRNNLTLLKNPHMIFNSIKKNRMVVI